MGDFSWPWQYEFPPFFTIQPNADTRRKQEDAWCSLILSYCRHKKLLKLDVSEAANGQLFCNKAIDRRLDSQSIVAMLDILAKRGHVEWESPKKQSCLIMWRTPEEWGKLIYSWAMASGFNNTVCTFYELISGDDTQNEEFHGIEEWLLMRALKALESQRKAEIIFLGEGSNGVKFF